MAKILEMPKLSPTMEEGVLSAWHKKEGDAVAVDDLLAEVETDKATMEFRAFDKGTLLKILVAAGSNVKLGQPVAILGAPGEDLTQISPALGAKAADAGPKTEAVPAASSYTADLPVSMMPTPSLHAREAAPRVSTASPLDRTEHEPEGLLERSGDRVFASPFVRKQARELGIDLRGATGTGQGGRVVVGDLSTLVQGSQAMVRSVPSTMNTGATPAGAPRLAEPEVRPLSMMRKTIARRLTESKTTVPHFYLTIDVDVEALVSLREKLNEELAQGEGSTKLSVNDLLVKACALALVRVPEANAQFSPEAILVHRRVDISVAVAVPEGLVTPVVRDADKKSVASVAREIRELAARAKTKKLKPEEMQDGTFSISNLGMFGIDEFSAVINPPEGAILAVGRVRDEPVVKGGQVVAGKRLSLTLSCDHRVIDGAVGAAFLAELRNLLERPVRILTG
jgi:pyruvate dehydrogenase E2 component (dihydrolipoamide acetyltransferase)